MTKNKTKNHSFDRREFLTAMGGIGSTLLIRSSFSGLAALLKSQVARADPLETKKYVYLHFNGGPPRWVFDLPLFNASATSFDTRLPMVVTRKTPKGEYEYAVAPDPWSGVRLPLLWQEPCLKSLLPHMQIIRGITNKVDGHPFGQRVLIHPQSNLPSISGLVADASDEKLGNINIAAFSASLYRSAKKKYGAVVVNAGVENQLRAPFSSSNPKSMTPVMKAVEEILQTDIPPQVLESFKMGQGTFYQTPSILKHSDKQTEYLVAISEARNSFNAHSKDYGFKIPTGDAASKKESEDDLNSFDELSRDLAMRFAALECSFFSGLSRSFTVQFGTGDGLVTNDAHLVNQADTLRGFTTFFLAFAACLGHFIRNLGPEYSNTVIQVAGDFNRIPRFGTNGKDATVGSDHGWEGNVTSLFGGALAPRVIGEVRVDPTRNNGHWGLADSPAHPPLAVATYVAQQLNLGKDSIDQLSGGVAFTPIGDREG